MSFAYVNLSHLSDVLELEEDLLSDDPDQEGCFFFLKF